LSTDFHEEGKEKFNHGVHGVPRSSTEALVRSLYFISMNFLCQLTNIFKYRKALGHLLRALRVLRGKFFLFFGEKYSSSQQHATREDMSV